jgi:hypothetical protein
MRRLPGPAIRPLCEGVHTPEAHHELFRDWQRTQTQSSVRTLRSLRQQMDVWFCLMQEPSAERHCCVTAESDQTHCAPSGARPGILCFSLDFDLHRWAIRQLLLAKQAAFLRHQPFAKNMPSFPNTGIKSNLLPKGILHPCKTPPSQSVTVRVATRNPSPLP